MLDCTVFCDMLVVLVALCHLFEIKIKVSKKFIASKTTAKLLGVLAIYYFILFRII